MQDNGGGSIDYGGAYSNANDFRDASPVRSFFRNKWVRLILILDILAIVAVIGIIIWNNTKTATINFSIAPLDAKIQIDGTGEYYNGSYQVHPGTHTITISHDGLEPKTFTMDLASGYNTTLTTFLAGADNNFDFYTLKDSYGSFQQLAAIASYLNNLTTDQDTSAESFISNFQYNYDLYQTALPIDYIEREGVGRNRSLVLDITIKANYDDVCTKLLCVKALMALTDDKSIVDRLLREKGFNPEVLQIEYQVF